MELLTPEKLLTYIGKQKQYEDYSKEVKDDYQDCIRTLKDQIRLYKGGSFTYKTTLNRTLGVYYLLKKGGFNVYCDYLIPCDTAEFEKKRYLFWIEFKITKE